MLENNEVVLDRYQVVRRLAVGGMGEIYVGKQRTVAGIERPVILKTMLPELTEDARQLTQFLDEARVVAGLNHPNIVSVVDVAQWKDTYVIVMEYIHGADLALLLRQSIKQGVPLPVRVAAGIARDAALGLDYAHKATDNEGRPLGIVHRDISPQNVMVRPDGLTKLVDFGIAAGANRMQKTEGDSIKGKLRYMSPEQMLHSDLDGRSDQWALGVVCWESVTWRPLFRGNNPLDFAMAVQKGPIPRPSDVQPGVPPSLEAVIMRMLERDREARFPSCGEVATALDAFLAETGGAATAETGQFVRRVASDVLAEKAKDLTTNPVIPPLAVAVRTPAAPVPPVEAPPVVAGQEAPPWSQPGPALEVLPVMPQAVAEQDGRTFQSSASLLLASSMAAPQQPGWGPMPVPSSSALPTQRPGMAVRPSRSNLPVVGPGQGPVAGSNPSVPPWDVLPGTPPPMAGGPWNQGASAAAPQAQAWPWPGPQQPGGVPAPAPSPTPGPYPSSPSAQQGWHAPSPTPGPYPSSPGAQQGWPAPSPTPGAHSAPPPGWSDEEVVPGLPGGPVAGVAAAAHPQVPEAPQANVGGYQVVPASAPAWQPDATPRPAGPRAGGASRTDLATLPRPDAGGATSRVQGGRVQGTHAATPEPAGFPVKWAAVAAGVVVLVGGGMLALRRPAPSPDPVPASSSAPQVKPQEPVARPAAAMDALVAVENLRQARDAVDEGDFVRAQSLYREVVAGGDPTGEGALALAKLGDERRGHEKLQEVRQSADADPVQAYDQVLLIPAGTRAALAAASLRDGLKTRALTALLKEGRASLEDGDVDGATERARKALRIESGNRVATVLLADAKKAKAEDQGESMGGRGTGDQDEDAPPPRRFMEGFVTAQEALEQAQRLANDGNRAGALEKAQMAVSLDHKFADGHEFLGDLHRTGGNACGARTSYERALKGRVTPEQTSRLRKKLAKQRNLCP
jgi:tetratricopeptide (TPR) repeat protein